MNLSGKLHHAAIEAATLEDKLERVTMCARWLLTAIDHAESIHDSELIRHRKQLKQALDGS